MPLKEVMLPSVLEHREQIHSECWHQLTHAKYRLPAPDVMDFYVEPADGHDDFLISLALTAEAMQHMTQEAADSVVRPRHHYTQESRY
jgi:hypothetical protein